MSDPAIKDRGKYEGNLEFLGKFWGDKIFKAQVNDQSKPRVNGWSNNVVI